MPEFRDGAALAPGRIRSEIAKRLAAEGISRRRLLGVSVSPRREPGRPNVVLPRDVDRWVAGCPACPGAEVVPEVGPFLCGSCGAVCDVDWEGV